MNTQFNTHPSGGAPTQPLKGNHVPLTQEHLYCTFGHQENLERDTYWPK